MKIPVTLLAIASASILGLALVACDKGNETSTTSTTSTTASAATMRPITSSWTAKTSAALRSNRSAHR